MPAIKITPTMRRQRLIRAARASRGLTQENVAKRLGVKQSSYQQMEKNINNVKLGRVCEICKILGLDINELVKAGKD